MNPSLLKSIQQQALATAPMPCVCLDPQDRIVWLNPAAETFGFKKEQVFGGSLPDLEGAFFHHVRFQPASSVYRLVLPHSEKRCRVSWSEVEGHLLLWLNDITAQLALATQRRDETQPYQQKIRLLNQLAITASGYSELLEVVLEDEKLVAEKASALRQYQSEVSRNLAEMLDTIRGDEHGSTRSGTVVIADAHQDLANLIAELLRTEGYRTECFTDASSVLHYLKVNGEGVSSVVIDEELKVDDKPLTQAVGQLRPGVEVIVLSGDENAGSQGKIAKPVDFKVLLRTVQELGSAKRES